MYWNAFKEAVCAPWSEKEFWVGIAVMLVILFFLSSDMKIGITYAIGIIVGRYIMRRNEKTYSEES